MSEQEYRPVDPGFNPASESYRAWRGELAPAATAEVAPEPSNKPAGGSTPGETKSSPGAK